MLSSQANTHLEMTLQYTCFQHVGVTQKRDSGSTFQVSPLSLISVAELDMIGPDCIVLAPSGRKIPLMSVRT